jgi:hypothetical protein
MHFLREAVNDLNPPTTLFSGQQHYGSLGIAFSDRILKRGMKQIHLRLKKKKQASGSITGHDIVHISSLFWNPHISNTAMARIQLASQVVL